MEYLIKSLRSFYHNPTLLLVVVFTVLSFVPMGLFLLLSSLTTRAWELGETKAAAVLSALTLIFFLLFLLYFFFIIALSLAGAYLASRKTKLSLIELFRKMRELFWRSTKYVLLLLVAWFVSFFIVGIGLGSSNIALRYVFMILGGLLILASLLVLLWVPAVLDKRKKVFASVKRSCKLLKKHKKVSFITLVTTIVFFLLLPNALLYFLAGLQPTDFTQYITNAFMQIIISSVFSLIGLIYVFIRQQHLKNR